MDVERFSPAPKRNVIAIEWRPSARPVARAVLRALRDLPGWEVVFVRTRSMFGRPFVPRAVLDRVRIETLRSGESRAELLNTSAIFVPAPQGLNRLRLEAAAAGNAIVDPPGVDEQPELAAAAVARLTEDAEHREREGARARAWAEPQSFQAVAGELGGALRGARVPPAPDAPRTDDPLADRPWILADLHLHTSWSHDCQIPVAELLDHAEETGLGAIAVTDHNVFGGALEAVEQARGRELIVIPGEEVKTDSQGEVIGLFLEEEIPRGLSFDDTVAAIREQGGIVYLPHPFDRIHIDSRSRRRSSATSRRSTCSRSTTRASCSRPTTRRRCASRASTACRWAPGRTPTCSRASGTGVLRMRAFEGPEEFMVSLRTAQVLRRPRSLLYLQSLKWAAQAKERVR